VVRGVRLGQFTKETARLALELNGGPVRITGVPQSGTTVTARLEAGADGVKITRRLDDTGTSSPAGAEQSPTAKALARRLTVRRGLGNPGSRGGFVRRDPSLRLEDAGGVLAGKVIGIDPGHGGWKSGAAGLNGLKEGDACLAMAQQLARALREAGATVLMTREGDTHVSLEDRWGFANAQRVDLFISIHCNAMPQHNTMSGSETYYCTPQSWDLARALHPQVVQVMGGRDGGIRRRNFAVIRHTTMPSVLLEVGYIDHTGDEAKLGDPGFQEEFGKAIRDGLIRYFGG
jgi:N-acetylmuramoyl-L-alanine amidase